MSAYFRIEVDDVAMFGSHEWRELGDECAHDCEHRSTAVIAWGPDLSRYELEECSDCGCRAWRDGRWTKARQRNDNSGFWHSRIVWRLTTPKLGKP